MSECLEYQGWRDRQGYGRVTREGRGWLIHRWAWTQAHGPIPEGLIVCHHCDNPPCYNVEHLYLGTHKTNAEDRERRGRGALGSRTHCVQGHEYTEDNTYYSTCAGYTHRSCRACKLAPKVTS